MEGKEGRLHYPKNGFHLPSSLSFDRSGHTCCWTGLSRRTTQTGRTRTLYDLPTYGGSGVTMAQDRLGTQSGEDLSVYRCCLLSTTVRPRGDAQVSTPFVARQKLRVAGPLKWVDPVGKTSVKACPRSVKRNSVG